MNYSYEVIKTLRFTVKTVLLLLLSSTMGNQGSPSSPLDRPHMVVYTYLNDGVQQIPRGSISCIHDLTNKACPAFGIKVENLNDEGSYLINIDPRILPGESLESLRIAGTATSDEGYGRMPLFPGCRYTCVAFPNSNNYMERYFGIIFNEIIADSVSIDIQLEFKE